MTEPVRVRHNGALMSKIGEYWTDDRFSDVDIKVGGKVFKCHRIILSAACKYFERMLSSKFKETSAREIILEEMEPNVFEKILQFVYTGDEAVINSSNVYDLIRAADYYGLLLMGELCVEFVQQNLSALADDILKIYTFAHSAGNEKIVELLSLHICENFHYFSKAPELSKLTFTNFEKVLDTMIEYEQPIPQDTFLEAIFTWIRHQVNVSVEDKKLYFDLLIEKIDFQNVSMDYTKYLTKKYVKEVISSGNIDDNIVTTCTVNIPSNYLHAYVSRSYKDGSPTTSSIFFRSRGNPAHIWMYSGKLDCSPDFMRNIVIDDRVYSLRYFEKQQNTNGPQQTFVSGSSIKMYPRLSLKLPPLTLNEFDMCGMGDYIYVYDKHALARNTIPSSDESTFSEDELSRGVYAYKRDADEWFPLPCPKMKFDNACMTCDEQIVYLVGGSNSNRYVQAYDSRTQEWFALPPTIGVYDGAACCTCGNKLLVAGGTQNPLGIEMYDPVSGNWQRMKALTDARYGRHQLVLWRNYITSGVVLSFSNTLLPTSNILVYTSRVDVSPGYLESDLFTAVDKYERISLARKLSILDMVYL